MRDGPVRPQLLQGVVLTLLIGEDVDNQIPIINEDPTVSRTALNTLRFDTAFGFDPIEDLLSNRTNLTLRGSREDQERPRDRETIRHIHQHRITRQLLLRRCDGDLNQIRGSRGQNVSFFKSCFSLH